MYVQMSKNGIDFFELTATHELRHNYVTARDRYASDQTGTSLLKQHRPDLARFATTNGVFTTGDGHKLAVNAGASAG